MKLKLLMLMCVTFFGVLGIYWLLASLYDLRLSNEKTQRLVNTALSYEKCMYDHQLIILYDGDNSIWAYYKLTDCDQYLPKGAV